MSTSQNEYSQFMMRRVKIANLMARLKSNLQNLDMAGWVDNVNGLREKVISDRFKVMIIGEFKRGKSTFINALLGDEILPAYATPCTAVINEVKWGMNQKAILHFRQPLPEVKMELLPRPVIEHISNHSKNEVPPMEIDIDNLENYVVIVDPAKDQAESIADTPFEKVEILWPLEICRNGVEIIDSPGLNEHGIRTRVTTEYLSKVDAILFVMSCQALASQSEMQFIDMNIRGAGHEDIFFICNRFDEIRPKEKERLVEFGINRLGPKTGFGANGVFFLSSIEALDGRMEKDTERVNNSGILKLEAELSRFLIHDRGKLKLLQPARELNYVIEEAENKVIPDKISMLEQNLSELENRYKKVKPQLEDLERRKRQILDKIEIERDYLQSNINRLVGVHLREFTEDIPTWVDEIEIKSKVSLFDAVTKGNSKNQATAIVKEITDKLFVRIETEQNKWKQESLRPLVNEGIAKISQVIESKVEDFYFELDNVKLDLTGAVKDAKQSAQLTAAERLNATAGITSLFDFTGTLSFEEILKNAGGKIALLILVIVVSFFNPITIIPVVVAAMIWGTSSAIQKVKSIISDEIIKHLNKDFDRIVKEISDEVSKNTKEIVKYVEIGLGKEIESVREQVEAVLRDKRAGEARVKERQLELNTISKDLKVIKQEFNEFISTLTAS